MFHVTCSNDSYDVPTSGRQEGAVLALRHAMTNPGHQVHVYEVRTIEVQTEVFSCVATDPAPKFAACSSASTPTTT